MVSPLTRCAGKTRYPTQQAAEAALAAFRRQVEARGDKIVGHPCVFRCKLCRYWHFGRPTGRHRSGRGQTRRPARR
jgi:type II secretory pathway component PulM